MLTVLWILIVLVVFLAALVAIAVGAYSDLAAENRRLRLIRLAPVHPSTRRNAR